MKIASVTLLVEVDDDVDVDAEALGRLGDHYDRKSRR